MYKIIRLCISISSARGDVEVIYRHGHGFQHRVWEIVHKSNCFLNLRFDDMDNKVILDEKMLFEGKVFGLFVVFEILADVIGERWVFFDLFEDCDVLDYSFLGLCLDEGAVVVGTQDCDITRVDYGNRFSDGLLLGWSIFLSFWFEFKVCLDFFLGPEEFGAEKVNNSFVWCLVVL